MKTNINQQLFHLYSSKWSNLCKAFDPIINDDNATSIPTSPLFLCVDEEKYQKADLKVMFFGQETNGWIEKDCYYGGTDENLKCLMDGYYDFLYNGKCWKHGGQFWNGVKRFQKILEEKNPDKNIHYIWNNIIKIGKAEGIGKPLRHISDVERSHFTVIQDEIKIINPDLIVFFSGPNYDKVIVENFGHTEFVALPPFTSRQLSKLSNSVLKTAVRTYHPNYLWRNDINKYISTIIDNC